jgi:hypothetical protein
VQVQTVVLTTPECTYSVAFEHDRAHSPPLEHCGGRQTSRTTTDDGYFDAIDNT